MNQRLFSFQNLTRVSLALMLLLMLWASKDFGITGDEVTQHTYGQKVFDFYATLGHDRSNLEYKNVYFYGGFYDMLLVAVTKIVPFDPYDVRHVINAFVGFLTILVVSRLGKRFGGWAAALTAAWFLFLSPRFFGEAMNNPKDTPFALAMALGVLTILKFVESFPKPTWRTALPVAGAIALAISIRVGGLLLIPYLLVALALGWWFRWRREPAPARAAGLRTMAVWTAGTCVVGYLAGLIFWPYGLLNPLQHPLKALGEMSQFSTGIRMLYDDRMLMSSSVPWYYIPKWIYITSPLLILACFTLSPLLFLDKRLSKMELLFLFFAAVFPVAYVIYSKSPLYDGWRHMLFVYPMIALLAALFFVTVLRWIRVPAGRYAVAGVGVLGLLLPARWMVVNHPHDIVYFNETVGGIDGAFGYYETDYYMNSLKAGTYKLADLAGLRTTRDSLVIATNCIEPVQHYLQRINPRLKPLYIRYRERYNSSWDYALFFSRFVDKDLLQNGHWPPAGTIATVKADNTPLCAIVKGDPQRTAYRANQAVQQQDFAAAVPLFAAALQQNPDDETAYPPYAIALANTGRLDAAIAALQKGLTLLPNSIEQWQLLAKLYDAKGDRAAAADAMNRAQGILMAEQEEEGQQ